MDQSNRELIDAADRHAKEELNKKRMEDKHGALKEHENPYWDKK